MKARAIVFGLTVPVVLLTGGMYYAFNYGNINGRLTLRTTRSTGSSET